MFFAQKVLRKRKISDRLEYLIKWLNYSEKENTWEPIENLDQALEMVGDYENILSFYLDEFPNKESLRRDINKKENGYQYYPDVYKMEEFQAKWMENNNLYIIDNFDLRTIKDESIEDFLARNQ